MKHLKALVKQYVKTDMEESEIVNRIQNTFIYSSETIRKEIQLQRTEEPCSN